MQHIGPSTGFASGVTRTAIASPSSRRPPSRTRSTRSRSGLRSSSSCHRARRGPAPFRFSECWAWDRTVRHGPCVAVSAPRCRTGYHAQRPNSWMGRWTSIRWSRTFFVLTLTAWILVPNVSGARHGQQRGRKNQHKTAHDGATFEPGRR